MYLDFTQILGTSASFTAKKSFRVFLADFQSPHMQPHLQPVGPDYDPYARQAELGGYSGFSRIRPYGVSSSDDEIRSTPECTSCGEEEMESESVSENGRV